MLDHSVHVFRILLLYIDIDFYNSILTQYYQNKMTHTVQSQEFKKNRFFFFDIAKV